MMMRMMLRRYSGALNSIFCCTDQGMWWRKEPPVDPRGKLNACAEIREKELLAYCHIQHAAQHSQFLMHCRCLHPPLSTTPFFVLMTTRCLSRPRRYVSIPSAVNSASLKFSNTALRCFSARFSARGMGGWKNSPNKGKPIPQIQCSAHGATVAACCCHELANALGGISALPPSLPPRSILGGGCLPCPDTASTRFSNPRVDTSSRHASLVLPLPTSCLNCARNGSNSDLRNRILRPITRKWGICFRSTQKYNCLRLTPLRDRRKGKTPCRARFDCHIDREPVRLQK